MSPESLLILGGSSSIASAYLSQHSQNYSAIQLHCNSHALTPDFSDCHDRLTILRADFSEPFSSSVDALISQLSYTNSVLISLAGSFVLSPFHKKTTDVFSTELNIQVVSVFRILQKILSLRDRRDLLRIVFINSIVSTAHQPGLVDYQTVKCAQLGLASSLASEYVGKGVIVNSVSPSMFESKLTAGIPEFLKSQISKSSPFGELIQTTDLTPIIHYFLYNASSLVTGQNITL